MRRVNFMILISQKPSFQIVIIKLAKLALSQLYFCKTDIFVMKIAKFSSHKIFHAYSMWSHECLLMLEAFKYTNTAFNN